MKVQYDKLLSTFAFKFNLRRYSMEMTMSIDVNAAGTSPAAEWVSPLFSLRTFVRAARTENKHGRALFLQLNQSL